MAPIFYYSLLTLPLFFFIIIKLFPQLQHRGLKNLPPGPQALPIIGNLHQLNELPTHRTFAVFSQTYGDIFSLWFGSRLTVVVSSPSLVQECFTKNDVVLANRPPFLTGKYIFFNNTTLGTASYGDHWRNLRRVTTMEVLSHNRLNSFLGVRRDEIKRLVNKLRKDTSDSDGFVKVELRSRLTEMTFNVIVRMISGKRYYGDDNDVSDVEEARQFRDITMEIGSLLGNSNKGDFLPLVRLFDLDNLEKRLKSIANRIDTFLQRLIDECRIEQRKSSGGDDTMIGHILKQQESQPEYYSDQFIKGLIQSMIIPGTGTSALTIEWVMTELLNHPDILKKVKDEIDTQVGKDRLIDENDLSKLSYLQNVISETTRLHPVTPLLAPHYSFEDCTIGGYKIPKNSTVLINAWQIHRDSRYWSDATSFKPQRFEKEGEVNKLILFGLGRRACPGIGLAQCIVGLTLGLLIQCFEWKRETKEHIDMWEGKGFNMPMKIPLEAMCKPIPIFNEISSD